MTSETDMETLTITLPARLIDEISELVQADRLNDFLVDAARHHLVSVRQSRGLKEGFGAWSDDAHPELATIEDTIAYVRSLRWEDDPQAEDD